MHFDFFGVVQVGAQIKQEYVRGDKVLWLGTQALSATAFVKGGKRRNCKLHTLRALVHALDRFVQVVLAKCAPRSVANCRRDRRLLPRAESAVLTSFCDRAGRCKTSRKCVSGPMR